MCPPSISSHPLRRACEEDSWQTPGIQARSQSAEANPNWIVDVQPGSMSVPLNFPSAERLITVRAEMCRSLDVIMAKPYYSSAYFFPSPTSHRDHGFLGRTTAMRRGKFQKLLTSQPQLLSSLKAPIMNENLKRRAGTRCAIPRHVLAITARHGHWFEGTAMATWGRGRRRIESPVDTNHQMAPKG